MIYRCWTSDGAFAGGEARFQARVAASGAGRFSVERKRIAGEQNRVLFHCHENLWDE